MRTITSIITVFILAVSMLFSLSDAHAQGRVSAYTVTKLAPSFSSIATTGTYLGMGDDDSFNSSINVPFAFTYDNTTYPAGTRMSVSCNGAITFRSSIDLSINTVYNPMLAQVFSDGQPSTLCVFSGDGIMDSSTSGVYYRVTGSAPNQILTVEFNSTRPWNDNNGPPPVVDRTSFQVKLYEKTGVIEFLYKHNNRPFASNTGEFGIGIIGGTPTPVPVKVVSAATTVTPDSNIRFTPPPPPNIQLSLTPEFADFGTVAVGSYADLTFTATHAGTQGTLTLGTASITGTYASEYSIISGPTPSSSRAVGESSTYVVRYTTQAAGTATATFNLTSNGRDSGTQTIALTGFNSAPPPVPPTIEVVPTTPITLFKNKRTSMGDSSEQFVVIKVTNNSPLYFTNYPNFYSFSGAGASSYSISRLPMNPIPGNERDTIWVMFKPKSEGNLPAVLTINNNSQNMPSFPVQLKGNGVISRIEAKPPTITYDSVVLVGGTSVKTLSIHNPGSDTLRITKQYFASNDGDFSFTPLMGKDTAIAPLATRTMQVTFKPLQEGTRQARIRFLTRIPLTYQTPPQDTGFIEVEIRGNEKFFGILSGIASHKDTVKVQSEICRTDTLWNSGKADLQVTSAALTGADTAQFVLSGITTPFNIKPKEYVLYTLCTTPQAVGTTKVSVVFKGVSNDKPVTFTAVHTVESAVAKSKIEPPVLFNGISVLKDTKRTETITLTNIDSIVTTYTVSVLKGDEYIVEADPVFTLWPGMSKTFAITFSPTSKGLKSGTLLVQATEQVDFYIPLNGTGYEKKVASVSLTESEGYRLEQNFPNPTTGATNLSFTVPASANVRIILADVTGNVIKELANGRFAEGTHQISVSTRDITSGTYLYILESNSVRLIRQMIVTK